MIFSWTHARAQFEGAVHQSNVVGWKSASNQTPAGLVTFSPETWGTRWDQSRTSNSDDAHKSSTRSEFICGVQSAFLTFLGAHLGPICVDEWVERVERVDGAHFEWSGFNSVTVARWCACGGILD